jgi:hypothetical protein
MPPASISASFVVVGAGRRQARWEWLDGEIAPLLTFTLAPLGSKVTQANGKQARTAE